MSYGLGVDLGTTFTAAAVHDGEQSRMLMLGSSAPAIPSLTFVRDDGEVLVGEAAERRAVAEPDRLSRSAKRLLGDPTPVFLGGAPFSAATLMATLLRDVLDTASEREGGAPARVVVTHPANWGPYKREIFSQVLAQAGLADATTITEPEAAAIKYSTATQLATGQSIAVYDLGGGTFDAAVLRRTEEGFELVGEAIGVEHLGGVDFDAAILRFVLGELDVTLDSRESDPIELAARSQLARSCVEAKIALSSDSEAVIPVLLPNRSAHVRVTRSEFEAMIRPILVETVRALQRAISAAEIDTAALGGVLLVGGSSRIPLIGALIQETIGRPVHLDADPKATIALGAAVVAAGGWTQPTLAASPTPRQPRRGSGSDNAGIDPTADLSLDDVDSEISHGDAGQGLASQIADRVLSDARSAGSTVDVVLVSRGERRVAVIAAIRRINNAGLANPDLGGLLSFEDAARLADDMPCRLIRAASPALAANTQRLLEDAGATIQVFPATEPDLS